MLQCSESTHSISSNSDFWGNLFNALNNHVAGAILGGILGGLLAVWIAIWMYKRERSTEFNDILRYMLRLIEGEIIEIKGDVDNLKKFKTDVYTNPSELPLLRQKASYDIIHANAVGIYFRVPFYLPFDC